MDTEAIKAKMKLAECDKAEVFDVMYEHFDALVAEVERLRAIVAKLPTTADGVPIVPGMEVWLIAWGDRSVYPAKVPLWFNESWTEAYSTEAAALAAKEKNPSEATEFAVWFNSGGVRCWRSSSCDDAPTGGVFCYRSIHPIKPGEAEEAFRKWKETWRAT